MEIGGKKLILSLCKLLKVQKILVQSRKKYLGGIKIPEFNTKWVSECRESLGITRGQTGAGWSLTACCKHPGVVTKEQLLIAVQEHYAHAPMETQSMPTL